MSAVSSSVIGNDGVRADMAGEGHRRAPSSPKMRSIASSLLFFIVAVIVFLGGGGGGVGAKTSSRRAAYSEPTPAEGGQVVHYNFTLGVAKRAPDCFREY